MGCPAKGEVSGRQKQTHPLEASARAGSARTRATSCTSAATEGPSACSTACSEIALASTASARRPATTVSASAPCSARDAATAKARSARGLRRRDKMIVRFSASRRPASPPGASAKQWEEPYRPVGCSPALASAGVASFNASSSRRSAPSPLLPAAARERRSVSRNAEVIEALRGRDGAAPAGARRGASVSQAATKSTILRPPEGSEVSRCSCCGACVQANGPRSPRDM